MKFYCNVFLIVVLSIFCYSSVFSQEKLSPLKSNPAYAKAQKPNYTSAKKKSDSLSLFIDDFSSTNVYPDSTLWEDHYVYINTTIAKNPPTIGVASFDGLNGEGQPWNAANVDEQDTRASEPCDTLTSKPIDLSNLNDPESLYLSFFYQPEGFASKPEPNDSLILEVKKENMDWEVIWRQEGVKYHDFKSVILHLGDSAQYLHPDFQFRFINYATPTGYNDFWHIDYVELNEGRSASDTIYKDLAFVDQPTSILKEYSEMTLGQFFGYQDSVSNDSHTFTISNLDDDVFPSNYYYQISVLNPNGTDELIYKLDPPLGTDDVPARDQLTQNINTLQFTNNPNLVDEKHILIQDILKDTLQIEMKYIIEPNNDSRKQNDTTSRIYTFNNQLAYDDGIVDVGYAVSGQGTDNAEIAQKYEIYERDFVYGVLIHFARINLTQTNQQFDLKVWSSLKGIDGANETVELAVIEDLTVAYPEGDNHSGFVLYCFEDGIFVEDQFYIGIKQKTSVGLHIGYDRNNNSSEKLYYNIFDEWLNSDLEGSLMMRPIIGRSLGIDADCGVVCSNEGELCLIGGEEGTINEECECELPNANNDFKYHLSFAIFPNPANEYISIDNLNKRIFNNDTQVELIDVSGKLVKSFDYSEANFYVGDLANGVYLIKIENENYTGVRKFVKTE